jgi:hypothetical protein
MKLKFVLSFALSQAALTVAAPSFAADLPSLPDTEPGASPPSAAPAAPSNASPDSLAPHQAPPAAPAPVAARAAEAPRDEAPSAAGVTSDPNKMWFLSGSVKDTFIGDRGFDPYSSNDLLPQWTFAGSRTLFSRGRFSVAGGASWDIGGSSTTSRGLDAGIFTTRFAGNVEGRWHPRTWVFGFVKLSPGAALVNARVNDPSAAATLTTTQWAFAGDASLGGAITPMTTPGGPRVWFVAEGGYSLSTTMPMKLGPKNEKDVTGAVSKTDLGELALSGGFLRLGAAVSF